MSVLPKISAKGANYPIIFTLYEVNYRIIFPLHCVKRLLQVQIKTTNGLRIAQFLDSISG